MMEKNRSIKVIAIVALCVSVLGLSLGFAAFSNTLVISSSANVNPDPNTFKVVFSSSDQSLATNKIDGVASAGATAGSATITNGTIPTITDLTAKFTEPGQTVTYTFYAYNSGEYEAFLKSISYANVDGANSPRVCTAKDGQNVTAGLLSTACEDISLKVNVGSTTVTGTNDNITGHSLGRKDYEPITVTITYANNGNHRVDGDFSVAFGDVSLMYRSTDA